MISITLNTNNYIILKEFDEEFINNNKLNIIKISFAHDKYDKIPNYIQYLVNLEYLDCSHNNFNSKVLKILVNLKTLICIRTNFKKLPYLPNLQIVDCSATPIETVENLDHIKELTCIQCDNLKDLDKLTNVIIARYECYYM